MFRLLRAWWLLASVSVGVNYIYDLPSNERGYAQQKYDYIVIGGGGVGCVVAATLALSGLDILLIERGDLPSHASDTAELIKHILFDPRVAQPVLTPGGVRTLSASVLGGGTAVNLGIWIEETLEYYHQLNDLVPGLNFTDDEVLSAQTWARNILASPVVDLTQPITRYREMTQHILPHAFGSFHGSSPSIQQEHTWGAYALFNGTRRSSAKIVDLVEEPNLTVLLNSTVLSIEASQPFADNTKESPIRISCVVYRATQAQDTAPLGSSIGISSSSCLRPHEVDGYPYRVCLKSGEGEIILSAGSIHTPLILMRSGIGPREEIAKLRTIPLTAHAPEIGRNLQDRLFIPISFFLKDDPPPIMPPVEIAGIVGLKTIDGHLIGFEDMIGGSGLQGAAIVSRLMHPPGMRQSLLADLVSSIFMYCVTKDRIPGGSTWWSVPLTNEDGLLIDVRTRIFEAGCRIVEPLNKCLKNAVAWWAFQVRVQSRGSITFHENTQQPIIDPNYLSDPRDIEGLKIGIRAAIQSMLRSSQDLSSIFVAYEDDPCGYKVFETEQSLFESVMELAIRYDIQHSSLNLSAFIPKPRPGPSKMPLASFPQFLPDPEDDEGLDKFVRSYATSIWHLVGSASLGRAVDENFRIPQVQGVSVIDASVLPIMPRMNPTASLLAIGRIAALRKTRVCTGDLQTKQQII